MHKWILFCLAYKKTIFICVILLLIASTFGILRLQLDYKMSVSSEDQFSQRLVVIAVYNKQLLDQKNLKQLAQLQQQLSSIKSVQKIISLYTAPNFRQYLDEHMLHSVLENQPYTQAELAAIKSDILDNRLFVGKFINKAADTMLFYLYIPNDKFGSRNIEIRNEIQDVLNQYKGNFSRIFQIGTAEMSYVLLQKAKHDILFCIPGIFILMAILFGLLFRNVFLFVLPIFTSLFGVICALGLLGWLRIPVSPLFISAVVLTLAIGVAESAHIIYSYQKSVRLHPSFLPQDHYACILKTVLFPFLLAVFTALLGFMLDILSFVPVIENAAYALAFCIIFNTSASIFVSPLLLPYLNAKKSMDHKFFGFLSEKFIIINRWLQCHKQYVIIMLVIIGVVGILAFKSIAVESLLYSMFKNNDPMMEKIVFVDKKVSGYNTVKINVYSENKHIFLEPEYLQKVLDSEQALLKLPYSTYIYSITDVIATTYQIFLFNTAKFFSIPKNKELLKAIYDKIEDQTYFDKSLLINKDYNQVTLYLNYAMYSSRQFEPYRKAIAQVLQKNFLGTPLHFKILDPRFKNIKLINNLLMLQIASIFSIYLICFFTVGIMFRSLIAGFISIIPNIFPLCIISIFQYVLNIPISAFSVILYSIVVGLSMDETIHIFYAFREQYKILLNKQCAIEAALKSQMTPVTITSVAIALSWLVLLGSQFLPMTQLGFLCGIGILSAWFADLVITPFLLQQSLITKRLSNLKQEF